MHLAFSLLLITATAAEAGPRVLVVPFAGDNAEVVERGLREGAGSVAGADVADAATTAALIDGAKSTGLDCTADDGACWLKVALLGGLDHVVYADSLGVTCVSATGATTSATLSSGDASWAAAVRRAFKTESALRIAVAPPTAQTTVDGLPLSSPLVEGLSPGSHVVAAAAPGFEPMTTTVGVAPGAVADVNLALVATAPGEASVLPAALVWGGVSALALGVALGTGIATYGWFSSDCTFSPSVGCPASTKPRADSFSVVAIGVGVGVGALGATAIAGSFAVQ